MKDQLMDVLAVVLVVILIVAAGAFAAIVVMNRYHRSHPSFIDTPIPSKPEDMQMPSLIVPSTTGHDVKG